MAVDVVWHKQEANILRYIFADNWTLHELESALRYNATLLQTLYPPPMYILDFRESGIVPLGWVVARPQLVSHLPIRKRVMVAVGVNRLIRVMIQVFMHYDPDFQVYFAKSIAEAEQMLEDRTYSNTG